MSVTFRSKVSPAALVAGHKFVGGRLVVDDRDAPAVRAAAAARPRLGIVEDLPPTPPAVVETAPAATRPKSRGTTRRAAPVPRDVSPPIPVAPVDTTPDVAAPPDLSGQDQATDLSGGGDVAAAGEAILGDDGPETAVPSTVATSDGSST